MSTHTTGKWLEHIVANDINGKFQPGSGCLPFAKGDVINDVFLVECKASLGMQIRVMHSWIWKIMRHASLHQKTWALAAGPRMKYTDNYYVIVPSTLIEEPEEDYPGTSKSIIITQDFKGDGPWKWRNVQWGMMTRSQFQNLNRTLLEDLSLSPDKKRKSLRQ